MNDTNMPKGYEKMNKEELEKYFDEKTDRYAKTELSRRIQKAAEADGALRAAKLHAQLHSDNQGPGRLILIEITGKQWDSMDAPDEVTVTTQGKYYKKNGRHYIVYREANESGLGETHTTMIYSPEGKAKLMRSGEQQLRMNFEEGKKEQTHYATPFGNFNLGFYTNKVDFKIGAKGGILKLSYNINASLQAELNTSLELRFTFLEAKKSVMNKK